VNNPRQPQHERDSIGYKQPPQKHGPAALLAFAVLSVMAVLAITAVAIGWVEAFQHVRH